MNYQIRTLLSFVEEILNPQHLNAQLISDQEFQNWKNFMVQELQAHHRSLLLRKALSPAQATHVISQLSHVSSTVHTYLYRTTPVWRKHAQHRQIKENYLLTLDQIENMITEYKHRHESAWCKSIITNHQLSHVVMQLKRRINTLKGYLGRFDIDPSLSALLLRGLSQMLRKQRLTHLEATFLDELIGKLIKTASLDTQSLKKLLYQNEFNLPEFFLYLINSWDTQFINAEGLHEQMKIIIGAKDQLNSWQPVTKAVMHRGHGPLRKELMLYLKEKQALVAELLELQRLVLEDTQRSQQALRFQINLPVAQLALFIRLQIEKGLLSRDHIGELFSFFATHFYTPNTLFISADSLQRKSTVIEFATAQKLKGQLIGMLNYLNEHFNLSNYKAS